MLTTVDLNQQVSSILTSARPKIQKWISDAESNDPEMLGMLFNLCQYFSEANDFYFCMLDIFLQMNDQMNSVLNRYEAFKKGDYAAAANPIPGELVGYVCFAQMLCNILNDCFAQIFKDKRFVVDRFRRLSYFFGYVRRCRR